MAPLRKPELLERVVKAVNESGWNVMYLAPIEQHPFSLQLYHGDESYRVRVYVWNLTHGGGRARPENEYRIQITGISPNSFEQMPGEKTLVLGWWEEIEVFAG